MLILECPNCGARNVSEFRFGGEYGPRPAKPAELDAAQWADYLYVRDNAMGMQKEWWLHNAGCGLWFLAERHTRSGEVWRTYLWSEKNKGGDERAA
jgi:sarcosine oxidase subunit delta